MALIALFTMSKCESRYNATHMSEDIENIVEIEEEIVDLTSLRLDLYIEALIFAAEYALNIDEIKKVVNMTFDQKFKKQHIEELIDNIRDKYQSEELAIQLVGIGGGYMFMTKSQYHKIIGDFLKLSSRKKLSRAALETLSIIAYKQPISKSEIEQIRGVNADYAVQKLLEKELVEIAGRAEGPGRPLLYGTSTKFLNHFGIQSTEDLPKLKEFETPEDTIGVKEEE
jgi:segregation and condensation protein B